MNVRKRSSIERWFYTEVLLVMTVVLVWNV